MMIDALLRGLGFKPDEFKEMVEKTALEAKQKAEAAISALYRIEKKVDLLLAEAYNPDELQKKLAEIFPPINPQ